MIKRHLRHCSARERVARQWAMAWQQQGFDVREGLASGRHVLHFITDSGWEGVIDLACWFSHRVPQSAGLASASWHPEQLEALFVSCEQPISGLPPVLQYQRIESKGVESHTSVTKGLYACQTPQGRVWIKVFPAQSPREGGKAEFDASHLPVSIQFQLGHSLMSLALLKQMQPGDVVLVNHQHNAVATLGSVLGQFVTTEEGFMFDENHSNMQDDDDMVPAQPRIENEVSIQPLASRAQVKVRLDVILQQSTLTIAELEAFYRGQVQPCHPDAQQNILLAVNGVAIAKGELMWIEDRLGVEITDIYQEVGNVSR